MDYSFGSLKQNKAFNDIFVEKRKYIQKLIRSPTSEIKISAQTKSPFALRAFGLNGLPISVYEFIHSKK